MIIGFTGTRRGMTQEQRRTVAGLLIKWAPTTVRHGDCVGADADFHGLVRGHCPGCYIFIHPGAAHAHSARAGCEGDFVHPIRPFLARNKDIVSTSDVLFAAPGEQNEVQRSGTWATIRYARKIGKEVHLVLP